MTCLSQDGSTDVNDWWTWIENTANTGTSVLWSFFPGHPGSAGSLRSSDPSPVLEESIWGLVEWDLFGLISQHWMEHKRTYLNQCPVSSFCHWLLDWQWKGHCLLYAGCLMPVPVSACLLMWEWIQNNIKWHLSDWGVGVYMFCGYIHDLQQCEGILSIM